MADFRVIGTLGQDPEISYSNSGTAISKFSVAENHSKKDGNEWIDDGTSWWRCVAFGKLAERSIGWTKGDRVCIDSGSVRIEEWEDKKGETQRSTKVIVNRAHLVAK